jgi:activator of HSP90 ATPase
MRSVIQQSVVLPAPADELFAMYLAPEIHAAITGGPAEVSAAPGSPFAAWGGSLSGTMLAVVAPRLIVQSWRSENFSDEDEDSTLILTFTPAGAAGRIDLVHLDVPPQDFQGVTEGWPLYYWEPWRAYLESRAKG